ncbi:MAG: CHAT domain-containing tetratricopeptide repeat protein [Chloroflexota bacterium]
MDTIDSEVVDRLIAIGSPEERILFLSSLEQALNPSELIAAFKEKSDPLIFDDPIQAQQITIVALEIAQWYQDKEAIAFAIWASANAHYYQGHHQECLDLYTRALEYFQSAEASTSRHRIKIGRLHSNCASTLTQMANYTEALTHLNEAHTFFTKKTADCLEEEISLYLAVLELNRSWLYQQLDLYREAMDSVVEGKKYAQMLETRSWEARLDMNRALALHGLHQYEKAIQLIHQARTVFHQEDEQLEIARADLNLGLNHYCTGQYRQALLSLEDAHTRFQTLKNSMEAATTDLHKVKIYLQLNQLPEAISVGRRAQSIVKSKHNLQRYAALAELDVGIALARIGERDAAWTHMTSARLMIEGLEDGLTLPLQKAQIDLERAWLVANSLHQPLPPNSRRARSVEEPEAILDQAIGRLSRSAKRLIEPKVQAARAMIRHRKGDDKGAVAYYLQALDGLKETGSFEWRYLAYDGLGRVYENLNAPEQALKSYQQAIETAMIIANLLGEHEARTGFLHDKLSTFDRAIVLHLRSGRINQALQLMEYLRMGHWGNSAWEVPKGDENQLGSRLTERLQRLRSLWHQDQLKGWSLDSPLHKNPSIEEQSSIQREEQGQNRQNAIESELTETMRTLRLHEVEQSAIENANELTEKLSVHALSQQLPKESCLLLYHVSHRCTHILLIDAAGFHTAVATITQIELHRLIDRLFFAFRGQDEGVLPQLHHLWELLIGPLNVKISQFKNLFIVPHERLYHLPFHALHDGTDYILANHTITYLPAAAILCQELNEAGQLFNRLSNHTPQDLKVSVFGCSNGGQLLGTQWEAEKISALFKKAITASAGTCHLFLEGNANQQTLFANSPDVDILHLAAHAQFRHDNPWFSHFHLGDGPLLLVDLAKMNLTRTPLVTLSACETGIGDVSGANVMGLSHAFIRAGAGALIVSLWKVPDDATVHFMEVLYQHIAANMAPEDALNQARHSLIQHPDFAHPYNWAGWIFIRCYPIGS